MEACVERTSEVKEVEDMVAEVDRFGKRALQEPEGGVKPPLQMQE